MAPVLAKRQGTAWGYATLAATSMAGPAQFRLCRRPGTTLSTRELRGVLLHSLVRGGAGACSCGSEGPLKGGWDPPCGAGAASAPSQARPVTSKGHSSLRYLTWQLVVVYYKGGVQ